MIIFGVGGVVHARGGIFQIFCVGVGERGSSRKTQGGGTDEGGTAKREATTAEVGSLLSGSSLTP